MGDYIRLVQLHKELDDDAPKEIKVTYTGVWASVGGGVLTIKSRTMGMEGDWNTLDASTTSGGFSATVRNELHGRGGWRLADGADSRPGAESGSARDWSAAYFVALAGYGLTRRRRSVWNWGTGIPSVRRGDRTEWDRRAIRFCCRRLRCKPISLLSSLGVLATWFTRKWPGFRRVRG